MMCIFSLLLVMALWPLNLIQCHEIYIIPSSSDRCLKKPCSTLSHFAANLRSFTDTNATITAILQPGKHILDRNLSASNFASFTLLPDSTLAGGLNGSFDVSITCGSSAMFEFNNITLLHISGIQFLGCGGNRVENVPSFTLNGCRFVGGGANKTALKLTQTTAKIESTSFISNSVKQPTNFTITVGGAMIVSQSNISIVDSRFERNRANKGGAIYSERDSHITIADSVFRNNHATVSHYYISFGLGGVMYLRDTTLSSSRDYFDRNSASGGGGVFYVYNSTINSTFSHFSNNRARHNGAVILGSITTINSTNSHFYNNVAGYMGGVLWLNSYRNKNTMLYSNNNSFCNNSGSYAGVMFISNLLLNSSNDYFYNNTAGYYGGVLRIGASLLVISNNVYKSNSADTDGGVFWILSSTINCTMNNFTNNRARKGGVIFAERTTFNSFNNNFNNNSASENGGVMAAQKESTIKSNCDVFNNSRSDKYGGVISINERSKVFCKNDSFLHSTGRRGGVLWAKTSMIKSSNDFFHKNKALRGGVIWAAKKSTLMSSNANFSENEAGRQGGVVWASLSIIISSNDRFYSNRAHWSGGVMWLKTTTVHSHQGNYTDNIAERDGGTVVANLRSNIESQNDYFYANRAGSNGGIIFSSSSTITSNNGFFCNNSAGSGGGVLWAYGSTISSYSDTFSFNSASRDGGVVYSHAVSGTYENITTYNNRASSHGGVFRQLQGQLVVTIGNFTGNSANRGGVMSVDRLRLIKLNETLFSSTTAELGSVFYVCGSHINTYRKTTLLHNIATSAVAYFMDSSVHLSGNTMLSDNKGSIILIASKVNFTDYARLTGGEVSEHETDNLIGKPVEGGAITAIQSIIIFGGKCHILNNQARIGGAIRSSKSTIGVHGDLTITSNSATESGGGIHLYQSELTCHFQSKLIFSSNIASTVGGGIHAISSFINVNSNRSSTGIGPMLDFVKNRAKHGGGVYLQMNSVVYIRKYTATNETSHVLSFTDNKANYGGAVFIPDNTKFGECTEFENRTHSIPNECPFQVMSFYGDNNSFYKISMQTIRFNGNTAKNFGATLYGSFFESCTTSHLTEGNITNDISTQPTYRSPMGEIEVNEISYLKDISDIAISTISTPPVKICFCKDGNPDCSYQHPIMYTDKKMVIPVALFDEVDNIVRNGAVRGYFNNSRDGSFLYEYKNRYGRKSDSNCTDFVFSPFSIHPFDDLILRADPGPCKRNSKLEEIKVTLQFPWCENCSIGFQRFEDREQGCRCDCHEDIEEHFTNCNATTRVLLKKSSAWISYATNTTESSTSGFIIHPHCPLDYCKPTDSAAVYINFNEENGADSQCAYSRSGTLCGSCPHNLSLSLGSSQCLACPKLWPLLTIAIILLSVLLGIALIALLLVLNLTVAVGTINALIFYANIVAANGKILLPFSKPNFATVFIAWLNLEFGLDACFVEGMDLYWRTWLQIVFPTYVIFLVVMVIIISERSMKFSHLIGKRNPIATLTTLILLSYTRLLHAIIAAFSFTTLKYPDGSRQTVWLPDGTVGYLSGKHIALFVAALLILMLGIVYTGLLFSWQWLLRYQHKKIFKWVRNQKLCQFLEPYHAPYNFKHRYWTGLLLFVRVVLYVVSATNVSGDPRVALVSTICLVGFLPLLKGFLAIRIYKSTTIDLMETITYFNLMFLSALSWYSLESDHYARKAIAYTSVSITFILLILVLVYHVYKYTDVISMVLDSQCFEKLFTMIFQLNRETCPNKQNNHNKRPQKINIECISLRVEPTYSVVEMQHPVLIRSEEELRKGPTGKADADSHAAEVLQTSSEIQSESSQYGENISNIEQIGVYQ